MARILTGDDVKRLPEMKDCIEIIDLAQRQFSAGEVVMPVRLTTLAPDRGNHLAMPAVLPKLPALGLKCISISPSNPSRNAPTLQGVVIYKDTDTGTVLAVMIPIAEGLFGPEHVSHEIGDVLNATKPGRTSDEEITIYQSWGLAVQDVATGKVVYDKALDQDVGVEVPF